MAQLDRLKEQLAYLKFWLGVVVVTEISLVGWIISTPDADYLKFSLALAGVALLSLAVAMLHRHIERRIDEIGRL
jgi:hypothetical protein